MEPVAEAEEEELPQVEDDVSGLHRLDAQVENAQGALLRLQRLKGFPGAPAPPAMAAFLGQQQQHHHQHHEPAQRSHRQEPQQLSEALRDGGVLQLGALQDLQAAMNMVTTPRPPRSDSLSEDGEVRTSAITDGISLPHRDSGSQGRGPSLSQLSESASGAPPDPGSLPPRTSDGSGLLGPDTGHSTAASAAAAAAGAAGLAVCPREPGVLDLNTFTKEPGGSHHGAGGAGAGGGNASVAASITSPGQAVAMDPVESLAPGPSALSEDAGATQPAPPLLPHSSSLQGSLFGRVRSTKHAHMLDLGKEDSHFGPSAAAFAGHAWAHGSCTAHHAASVGGLSAQPAAASSFTTTTDGGASHPRVTSHGGQPPYVSHGGAGKPVPCSPGTSWLERMCCGARDAEEPLVFSAVLNPPDKGDRKAVAVMGSLSLSRPSFRYRVVPVVESSSSSSPSGIRKPSSFKR